MTVAQVVTNYDGLKEVMSVSPQKHKIKLVR
jgi:hypothetical protein